MRYEIFIKEKSWIARVAAYKLQSKHLAIVIGKTIHLYNTPTSLFLSNHRWLKHELCHIEQFEHHGYLKFVCLYLIESLRNGYFSNKFEIQARNAEMESCKFSFIDPTNLTKSKAAINGIFS
jgi:hypothetical protein